jgi:hypothetical protein
VGRGIRGALLVYIAFAWFCGKAFFLALPQNLWVNGGRVEEFGFGFLRAKE